MKITLTTTNARENVKIVKDDMLRLLMEAGADTISVDKTKIELVSIHIAFGKRTDYVSITVDFICNASKRTLSKIDALCKEGIDGFQRVEMN